jgi:multidrug efflux pump subunit AcrA (membrane-fusion protein)
VLVQEGNKVVFVLNGQTVTRRVIQTGGVAGSLTEIISGVGPGETIVVDGAGFLKDGDTVRVFTALAGN